jgi:ABC-type multidrug transport system fused ATPase/permease subunit
VPIEIEGKDPKPAQLKELIHHAREHGIKVVFVQPQFSAKSAEMVAREIGGQVVAADPLAADWAENLREVGRRFKAAFPLTDDFLTRVTNLSETIIDVSGVWFAFNGQPVLQEVNLKVPRGDFLVVIGPNGGGKTTLLKLMLGLLTPTRGTVRVFGLPPARRPTGSATCPRTSTSTRPSRYRCSTWS